MPLPPAESVIPVEIGDLSVVLTDYIPGDETPARKTATFSVQVLNGDGEVMKLIQGDLVPHLTTGQKNALLGFIADLRVRAEQEILP